MLKPRQSRVCEFVLAIAAAAAAPVILGIDSATLSRAQSKSESYAEAFEVASVRPAAAWKAGGEGSQRSRIQYSPLTLTMRNVDLSDCVQWAYGVKFYQISGPDSLNAEHYDIQAKAEGSVTPGQLRVMLQDLLAKRFRLQLHRETKMIPVYDLVVAKGGPKLPAPKSGADLSPAHASESLPLVEDGNFVFRDTSITDFAGKLSLLRGIDRPVVDQTRIQGVFDITLKSAASALLDPDGPSLFTLVREQLGLRLVPAMKRLEILVIDRIEKPSEN